MNVAISTAKSLPTYAELLDENSFLERKIKGLVEDVNYLEEQVRHLRRLRFAPSSEATPYGQRTLFNEAEVITDDTAANEDEEEGEKKEEKETRPSGT